MEDFSDLLLQKMLQAACRGCQDNDKVRIHAIRALGNLLKYTPARPLGKFWLQSTTSHGLFHGLFLVVVEGNRNRSHRKRKRIVGIFHGLFHCLCGNSWVI